MIDKEIFREELCCVVYAYAGEVVCGGFTKSHY